MKRIIAAVAAPLLASALAATPALAQGKSESAPGHNKSDNGNMGMGASSMAPGHLKQGGSARDFAPGQLRGNAGVDAGTTASVGNFGRLISSIRAGKSDLSAVNEDTTVNLVSVDSLIHGNNRAALDNALGDNQDQVEDLRDDLAELDLGLTDAEIDSAVAARMEADGSLTVYTD